VEQVDQADTPTVTAALMAAVTVGKAINLVAQELIAYLALGALHQI
jgi:uncharacterized protein YoaH (UPF0181 family)